MGAAKIVVPYPRPNNAEVEVLKKAASSKAGQDAVAHAVSIATGGPPVLLICEENSRTF